MPKIGKDSRGRDIVVGIDELSDEQIQNLPITDPDYIRRKGLKINQEPNPDNQNSNENQNNK